jgi:membrane fusion protein (multidrug efflux system)
MLDFLSNCWPLKKNSRSFMGSPFSSSTRSLANDKFSPSLLVIIIAAIILGLWTAWLVLAKVSVYEMSESGRIEIDTSLYPVAAPISGKVLTSYMEIGREVQQGDLLIEFESQDERLRLDETNKQITTLGPELDALRDEVAAEQASRKEQLKAAQIAIDQARSQLEEARAAVQLAEDEAARTEKLQASGLQSEVDLARAKTEARMRQAAAEALRLQIDKLQANLLNGESESQVRVERINRQIASIEGQIATANVTSKRLAYDIEKRAIKAPASGRIGEAIDLSAGAVISAGDKIGVIIPRGDLKAVAYFRPSLAVGRIQPGQTARLRLEGFPWTEYGVINATVATVASEPRDGQIRIELALHRDPDSAIPFQHGLPASVEIEVTRLSPASLLLRAAGERIRSSQSSGSVPATRRDER